LCRYILGGERELVDRWLGVMSYTPVSSLGKCGGVGPARDVHLDVGGGGGNGDGSDGSFLAATNMATDGGDSAASLSSAAAGETEVLAAAARRLLSSGGGGGATSWGQFVFQRLCPIVSLIESIVPVMLVLFPAVHGPLAVGAYHLLI
jgi:hypothetical protein